MKRLSRVALAGLLGFAGNTDATSLVRVATMDTLAQVWIGGATADPALAFCRLEVNKEGIGLFTVQRWDSTPALAYRVSKTLLTAGAVEFVLVPIGTHASVSLSGWARPSSLYLKLGAADPKEEKRSWMSNRRRAVQQSDEVAVVLQTETAFTARLKAVTERALWERQRQK